MPPPRIVHGNGGSEVPWPFGQISSLAIWTDMLMLLNNFGSLTIKTGPWIHCCTFFAPSCCRQEKQTAVPWFRCWQFNDCLSCNYHADWLCSQNGHTGRYCSSNSKWTPKLLLFKIYCQTSSLERSLSGFGWHWLNDDILLWISCAHSRQKRTFESQRSKEPVSSATKTMWSLWKDPEEKTTRVELLWFCSGTVTRSFFHVFWQNKSSSATEWKRAMKNRIHS